MKGTGHGGVAEAVSQLTDDDVYYGFSKLQFVADDNTKRVKYVLWSYKGPSASILRKAAVSVHKAAVKSIFTDYALEFDTDDKSELTEEHLIQLVKDVNY